LRRLYLIANRDGWNQRDSAVYLANDFAIHQIGYDGKPERSKLRMQKLRQVFREAEERGIIRPCPRWNGFFQIASSGPFRGHQVLRWSRGPRLKVKESTARSSLR